MKLPIISSVAVIAFGLSACSQSVPKCGDSDVTDIVINIADQYMARHIGEDAAKKITYTVNAIRTTSTNKETGAHECAADIKYTGKTISHPIAYTVENTDDGKDIYVKVSGLYGL